MNKIKREGKINKKGIEKFDECICAEWDGKGWSTCGFPCSVHNKLAHQPKKLTKYLKERRAKILKLVKDMRSGKIKETKIDF